MPRADKVKEYLLGQDQAALREALSAPPPVLGEHRVMILTPLRSCDGYSPRLVRALWELSRATLRHGLVQCRPFEITGPVINYARACLAHLAFVNRASHAFFVDNDVAPTWEDVRDLLAVTDAGADAVCIPYANRRPNAGGQWEEVLRQRGAYPGQEAIPYAEEDVRTLGGHRLYRIARTGFGCMMLTAGALRKLRARYFEAHHCVCEAFESGEEMVDFFHPLYVDRPKKGGGTERHEEGEDFSVCERIEEAGMRLECLVDRRVAHKGLVPDSTVAQAIGLPPPGV